MIISAVVEELVYYNAVCNQKQEKSFHRRVKTVVNRHNFHVEKK